MFFTKNSNNLLRLTAFLFLLTVFPYHSFTCYSMNSEIRYDNWNKMQKGRILSLEFVSPGIKNQLYIQAPIMCLDSNEKKILLVKLKPLKRILKRVNPTQPFLIELNLDVKDRSYSISMGFFESQWTSDKMADKIKVSFPTEFIKDFVSFYLKKNKKLNLAKSGFLEFKNNGGEILARIKVSCLFPFRYKNSQYLKLDAMIVKNHLKRAEKFCNNLTEEHKNECYQILGEAFFTQKKYEQAIFYYEKSGYKRGFNRIAEVFFKEGDIKKATFYYEKGIPPSKRAHFFTVLADDFKNKSEVGQAKVNYKKAIDDYEFLIKSYHYKWIPEDSMMRRKCILELKKLPRTDKDYKKQKKINEILKQAAAYCKRLNKEFYLFFCKEVITDYINPFQIQKYAISKTNKYVYDYQLIKKDGETKESRILLKKNGLKLFQKDADLESSLYYENLLFGPNAFFSKNWQDHFDFKIKGEYINEKGNPEVIVEVIPLFISPINRLMGDVYFREEDGKYKIFKLEWNPKTIIENFAEILEIEKALESKLLIRFYAEFNIEHKDVYLPSKYYFEFLFLRKNGRMYLYKRVAVKFIDHKYFDVGTDVTKIAPSKKGKLK